jgi:hypothetical protein
VSDWIRGCHDSACVEVARFGQVVVLRASVVPRAELTITVREWREFVAGVKAGRFDEVTDA